MIYSIFPKHTATIYERYPEMNTSRDEILELNKTVSSSAVLGLFNTKILLDFDLYTNSQSMTTDGNTAAAYFLNLYTSTSNTPDNSFTIKTGPVADAWTPGLGRSTHFPITKTGVAWNYPSDGNTWTNTTASFTGTTNTIEYSSIVKDLRINITPAVQELEVSSGSDKGLLVSRTVAQELDGNKYGHINFYSAETSTIYKPRLEIHIDDGVHTTGSLTALDLTAEYYVYQANNLGTYKIDSTPKFRFIGREKYPTATYTASTAALVEYLPTSSYYSLVDVRTGETVVPFDTTYTKISCDANGNFANLKLSGIYPERLYQFHIRIDHDGIKDYHVLDDMFRVYE
jgi:hypothetical protein